MTRIVQGAHVKQPYVAVIVYCAETRYHSLRSKVFARTYCRSDDYTYSLLAPPPPDVYNDELNLNVARTR